MIGIGKKGREWQRAKRKLIKLYTEKKIIRCENCGSKFGMSFHHRPNRASQRAVHDFEHTRLLCAECHTYFEINDDDDEKLFKNKRGYNREDKIMTRKGKKSKKADWQRPHICINCKKKIGGFGICPFCGKISI